MKLNSFPLDRYYQKNPMPSDDKISSTYKKLLIWAAKRQQKQNALSSQPVMVREIIVTQKQGTAGEFAVDSQANSALKKNLRNESDADVVERMLGHIKCVTKIAKKIHLKANFDPLQSQMLSGNENHITRVTFNEFYFYPYKKRGPLTQERFLKLLKKIESIAQSNPENLHLTLSSFPVIDMYEQVHNMVIYVQCGKEPKLDVFAKAFPSSSDVEYPRTTSPFFRKGEEVGPLVKNIENLMDDLLKHLRTTPPYVDIKAIRKIQVLIRSNANYIKKSVNNTVDNTIEYVTTDEYRNAINVLNKLIAADLLHSIFGMPLRINVDKVRDIVKVFTSSLEMQSARDKQDNLQSIKHTLPSTFISAKNNNGVSINYGGNILCTTAGGAKFTTAIDICLDHCCGVARLMHKHSMGVNEKSSFNYTPSAISYVVTSNSTSIEKGSVLGEQVTLADPEQRGLYELKPSATPTKLMIKHKVIKMPNPKFGPAATLHVYPPRRINEATDELKKHIDMRNTVNTHDSVLNILQTIYPSIQNCRQALFAPHNLLITDGRSSSPIKPSRNKFKTTKP